MDGCKTCHSKTEETIQETTITGAELAWRNRNKILQLPVLEIQTERWEEEEEKDRDSTAVTVPLGEGSREL